MTFAMAVLAVLAVAGVVWLALWALGSLLAWWAGDDDGGWHE